MHALCGLEDKDTGVVLPVKMIPNGDGTVSLGMVSVDSAGNETSIIDAGAGKYAMLVAQGPTNFVASVGNSSYAQLAAGATFPGAVESIYSSQAISVLVSSDRAGTLVLTQYIDGAGAFPINGWSFPVAAGVPFSRSFTGNGNFFKLTFQNTSGSATTNLRIDTAYGVLPAATNLGNNPVSLDEVSGTAVTLGQKAAAASLPVVTPTELTDLISLAAYNVAGVIPINTDLVVIDCLKWRWLSVHATSIGTAGAISVQFSNDPAFAGVITAFGWTETGMAGTATLNVAQLRNFQVLGRYARVRLTTATTAGTTTVNVFGSTAHFTPGVSNQVISGSLTSAGTVTSTPVTPTTLFTNSLATVNLLSVKASAGTLWSILASNTNAAVRYLKFYNKASAPVVATDIPAMVIALAPGVPITIHGGANGIRFSTGIALAITVNAVDNDNTAVAAAEVKVATTYS